MYINSKVCFSCSHEEKKNFPSNSKLFSYFVDISFSSAAIQANKNAQSEYFPNLYPGRVSSPFLPLVFCPLFLVYQHDSPCTEHKLRIAFLGVVMCLLSVIHILSSHDICGQRQRFARQLTHQSGEVAQPVNKKISPTPCTASCPREKQSLHYGTPRPTEGVDLNVPVASIPLL